MSLIPVTPGDLAIAAVLVGSIALLSARMRLGLQRQIVVAATRTCVQLLLVGFVLETLFANRELPWVTLIALAMLLAAGREVVARQKRRLAGWWGFGIGTGSMFVSSFAVTLLALVVILGPTPWYDPRYAIPLLGMLLGNTMTGIALGMDRLLQTAWDRRPIIEQRLLLGESGSEAIADIRRDSTRAATIPILNAMAAAGIVSLPGMMTGQILAGSSPVDAVKYQILIMFLIAGGTGFGALLAIRLVTARLFDERDRLRLDRLRPAAEG